MDQSPPVDVTALHEQLLRLLGGDATHYPTKLEERFPRIIGKIVELWGRPELDTYFNGLMVSERHDRQGFPGDVAMEIFQLSNVHAGLHLSDTVSGTGWTGVQDAEMFRKALKKEAD
ncbi:MAG: hypothetical protein CVU34_12455 [Betaproteobacteria bacterium HGW-Betaproteobacteria-7]|jgi:hypothetical protein|nr:MAG: hypothetical protein CVU34_12455 [Betaproteobacteria bacterium HGW-Betaproteobacteria-7]